MAEAWAMVAQLRARGLPLLAGHDTFGMGSHVAIRVWRNDGRLRALTFTVLDPVDEVEAMVRRQMAVTWPINGPLHEVPPRLDRRSLQHLTPRPHGRQPAPAGVDHLP